TNFLYSFPITADWEYASVTKNRLIFPRMTTLNCSSFVRCYVNQVEVLGSATGYNLGQKPEPIRVYYRTTGISDNSGSWYLLSSGLDISGVSPADYIQFMIEFK